MAASGETKSEDPRARLDNLQKKYDGYIQRRNELNDSARQLRTERDLLNEGRRTFKEQMDTAKAERDRLNGLMREAKAKRNELQAQAKDLIASRQAKGGGVSRSLPLQARQLEKQIRDLELKQQTQPHSIEEERELLKIIKAKSLELKEIQGKLTAEREVKVDLSNLDQAIDELFRKADELHKEVQAYHAEASKHHEAFVKASEESRVLSREGNEKHKAYIEARQNADEQHQKAMELREQMIGLRNERRAEFEAHKRELNEINKQARDAVMSPKAMEEKAEEGLEALKKGGKISFGI